MFQMKETLLEIPPSLPPNLTGIREMNAKTDRYQRSHTDLHEKKKKILWRFSSHDRIHSKSGSLCEEASWAVKANRSMLGGLNSSMSYTGIMGLYTVTIIVVASTCKCW